MSKRSGHSGEVPASHSDYDVGYAKPPKHSQFEVGRSGNPSGRPRGVRSVKADLEAELSTKVRVSENGRPIRLSKQQLMVKAIVAKAIKGDVRATAQVFELIGRLVGLGGASDPTDRTLSSSDEVILAEFLRRNQAPSGPNADD